MAYHAKHQLHGPNLLALSLHTAWDVDCKRTLGIDD